MIQDRVCIYSILYFNEKYIGVLLFLNVCVDTARTMHLYSNHTYKEDINTYKKFQYCKTPSNYYND